MKSANIGSSNGVLISGRKVSVTRAISYQSERERERAYKKPRTQLKAILYIDQR